MSDRAAQFAVVEVGQDPQVVLAGVLQLGVAGVAADLHDEREREQTDQQGDGHPGRGQAPRAAARGLPGLPGRTDRGGARRPAYRSRLEHVAADGRHVAEDPYAEDDHDAGRELAADAELVAGTR